MSDTPDIQILPDAATLARIAADAVVRYVQEPIVTHGVATVALAGGSTPRRLYELLARPPHSTRLDFASVRFFFGDERCVPPDDPRSNYRMARETMFVPAGVADANVFRIRGELPPADAAADYERTLRGCGLFSGDWPVFDLLLLGLGDDGHTASLFPGTAAVEVADRWVTASRAPADPRDRVSLTLGALCAARQVIFLVSGRSKAGAVARVLGEPEAGLPAARVRPAAGQVHWLLDADAASQRHR
ncbi:MAG: 6-phosphogluconolactonase [Phycisphaerae bacterium]|nr:6-phosphogluconolactonase [Phycisphaerae bacterium]